MLAASLWASGSGTPEVPASFFQGVENGVLADGNTFLVIVAVALVAFVLFYGLRAWAAEVGTGWGIIGVLTVIFLVGLAFWYYGHTTLGPVLVFISVVLIVAAGARGKQRRDG